VNLKQVGMKRKLSRSDQLLQVDINLEIEPATIDRTLLQSAGNIAKGSPI